MNSKLINAISVLGVLLLIGTLFYHFMDQFSWIDSFYLTSITLTTIGYGDIHPVTDVSKVFTSLFAIAGVSLAVYALTVIGADYFEQRERALVGMVRQAQEEKNQLLNSELLRVDKHIATMLKHIDRQIKR